MYFCRAVYVVHDLRNVRDTADLHAVGVDKVCELLLQRSFKRLDNVRRSSVHSRYSLDYLDALLLGKLREDSRRLIYSCI